LAINTTRLSQKIGKILGGLNETNDFLGTTLEARVNTIYAQYTTYGPENVTGIFDARNSDADSQNGWINYLKTLISDAIVTEVQLDRVLPSPSLTYAIPEWVRQMRIAGDSFQDCPATLAVSAVGVPTGTYTFVTSSKDGTGVGSDLCIPDVYLVTVTADNENGGTRWAETFGVVGKAAAPDPATYLYPTGSGVNTSVAAIDPAAGSTLTTDPSFENWTSNTPDDWTIASGVAGSTVFKVADDPRDGSDGFALRFVGNGTNVLKIRQVVTVSAATVYDVYFRVKKVTDPGTDWGVTVRLVDTSTGTAVSGSSVLSATAASVAANWTNIVTGTIVTPATMPLETAIEIVFSQYGAPTTAAANTAECYVDWVNIVEPTSLYAAGPNLSIWSGTTEGVNGDTWTYTVTLGAAVDTFMIRGMDRLLGLSSYTVRIPTAGSPTQLDSLIS